MTLSILVSALSNNLSNFEKWLDQDIVELVDEFIIVIQGKVQSKKNINRLKNIGCKIILDNKKGVSRSRNLAIKNSNSDFLWILDDDVHTYKKNIIQLREILTNEFSADVITCRYAHSINKKNSKNYFNKKYLNRYDLLKVSSIEIIVKRSTLKNLNVKFDERFGLGSNYPSCEENLFLLNLYNKGSKIIHIPLEIAYHPDLTSGNKFNPKSLIAKGYLCTKYGFVGFLILVYWLFKFSLKYRSFDIFNHLFKGYVFRIK
tara:strand:- start:4240 stop:5019 length:780 start_codon:yes stop_codon:yes gene_type:complete